jgi:hypothetical protein
MSYQQKKFQKAIAIIESLLENMPAVRREDIPEPTHEGPCGPWAPCDDVCSEIAHLSMRMYAVKQAKDFLENTYRAAGRMS